MKSVYVAPGLPAQLVDVSLDQIRAELGWLSFAYPFEDDIAFVHDDDGIQNKRQPNRTLNGELMPGPFFILAVSNTGELTGLSDAQAEHYLAMFKEPEVWPAGRWDVQTSVDDLPHTSIIRIKSSWIPVCPLCSKDYTEPPALSRVDNKSLICPTCGMREALEAAGFKPELIEKIITESGGGTKMNFTASNPPMPLDLSLKARLAWIYFFTPVIPQLENSSRFSWNAIKTSSGSWVITDEACDLDEAQIFPDEESFISWLEATASDHLSDDPVGFLRNFVSVVDLITPSVAEVIIKTVL